MNEEAGSYRRSNDDKETGRREAEVDDQTDVEEGEVAERHPVRGHQGRPGQRGASLDFSWN